MGRWFCNVRSLNKDLESLDSHGVGRLPVELAKPRGSTWGKVHTLWALCTMMLQCQLMACNILINHQGSLYESRCVCRSSQAPGGCDHDLSGPDKTIPSLSMCLKFWHRRCCGKCDVGCCLHMDLSEVCSFARTEVKLYQVILVFVFKLVSLPLLHVVVNHLFGPNEPSLDNESMRTQLRADDADSGGAAFVMSIAIVRAFVAWSFVRPL